MLQLLVSTKSKHLFSTTGGITFFEALVNNIKKLFKLKGDPFFQENCDEFLSYQIGEPA